ncbi:hypothetical protein AFLA_002958 [Aspergillus flavus NRRL3357]|nr:hypothetical protein AFLA_002958 [Aspergillus flavus NRRL3357]
MKKELGKTGLTFAVKSKRLDFPAGLARLYKWEKAIDLSLMRASSLEEQLCWGKGVSNLKGCRESCLVDISGDAILVPKAYGLLP